MADSTVGEGSTENYDEFGRLTSQNYQYGWMNTSINYVYDRYGNRWQQNITQGSGPQPQLSFNASNNQVVGYQYDAAGNVINDGVHSYSYDGENNLISIDGGATATFVYDALNERVKVSTSAGAQDYGYDLSGRRSTVWLPGSTSMNAVQYYAGSNRVAYWTASDGNIHFEHQDWLGTERMRTSATASVDGSYSSLPFGDNLQVSGSDTNPGHFVMLDQDVSASSGLSHAKFREYSETAGRWMSPDPYSGSYKAGNPQSFNRYSYVKNRPLSHVDPSGLDEDISNGDDNSPCDVLVCYTDDGSAIDDGGGGGDPNNPGECATGTEASCISVSAPPEETDSITVTADAIDFPPVVTEVPYNFNNIDYSTFVPPLFAPNNPPCSVTVKCRGIQTKNLGALGFQHCDAQVTDSSGATHSDSGGPMNYHGEQVLNAWDTSPPTEPFTGNTVYTGNSCHVAGCVINATQTWNKGPLWPPYNPFVGPNSNTFLKQTFAGCGVSLPINTWGSTW